MDAVLYRIVRPVITLLFKIIYRPKYQGLENIPKEGNFVLAGNHTHNFDCLFLISSTKRTIHFLAKDSLVKGMKRFIFIPMGIIPVNRKVHDKNALNSAISILNEGNVIGIFPEGTYHKKEGELLPFKIGAVKMSQDTKSLLVPFIITGKYKPFQKGLEIKFLKPYQVKEDLEIENERLKRFIQNEL